MERLQPDAEIHVISKKNHQTTRKTYPRGDCGVNSKLSLQLQPNKQGATLRSAPLIIESSSPPTTITPPQAELIVILPLLPLVIPEPTTSLPPLPLEDVEPLHCSQLPQPFSPVTSKPAIPPSKDIEPLLLQSSQPPSPIPPPQPEPNTKEKISFLKFLKDSPGLQNAKCCL